MEIEKRLYTTGQIISLTILRILIGWHFLYEGMIKFYTPGWSAKAYLSGAVGPFSSIFHKMAQSAWQLKVADTLNMWGLTLIGLSLFVGFLSKPFKVFGIILLLMYYLAYPPFADLGVNMHVEGSYWIVNKNLIEMASLFVLLMFPSSCITGIDRFINNYRNIYKRKSNFKK